MPHSKLDVEVYCGCFVVRGELLCIYTFDTRPLYVDTDVATTSTHLCIVLVSTDSDVAHEVTLIPCNGSYAFQSWRFDKGLTTVTSITNVGAGLALGVGSATLFSAKYVAHSPVAPTSPVYILARFCDYALSCFIV